MQLNLGDLLEGRYRIEAPIARGGMSTVYRCVDTRLGRNVAAKVMHEEYAGDPIFAQRFRREARSMAHLSHPHLVGVYDFNSDGDHVFLIMELITGGTLRELLAERGAMPDYAASAVMRSVLTGLAAVHNAGMVHRDLKPDNILIDGNHQVKLSDFGLVRAASASQGKSNQIVGTVAYLSPEQVSGDDITTASDVYSAGIVLFELLTGTTPFNGDTPLKHAYARLDADVPKPSSRIDGVPKLMDELVATATARDPKDRFKNADEFLTALNDVASELQFPAFTVPVPQNAPAPPARPPPAPPPAPPPPPTPPTPVKPTETAILNETSVLDPFAADPFADPTPYQQPGAQPQAQLHNPPPGQSPWPDPSQPQQQGQPPAPRPQPRQPARPSVLPPAVTNRSRTMFAAWWVIVIMLTLAIAIGAWWFGSGRYGEVPQVIGMDQTTATQTLKTAGFESKVATVYDDNVAIDMVAGTDPTTGEKAVKGDAVTLLVSLGKPTVPSLDGLTNPDDYNKALSERSLVGEEGETVYSDNVPQGQIASVTPSPHTMVNVNSTVTYHLSQGPAPVNVPNVHNTKADEAKQQLQQLGFNVKVENKFDDSVKGNYAIGTNPDAGSQATRGSDITLYVSTAVEIPDLAGVSEEAARDQLAKAGIRVESVTRSGDSDAVGKSANDVYITNPQAGTLIDSSQTTVTIELVNKVEVPNVIGKRLSEARTILQDAGFKVKAPSSANSNSRVIYQSPSFLSEESPETRVELRTLN
jgi:putative serine/threonine-protein kinase prkC